MYLSTNLRYLREKNKYTQRLMSKVLGIHRSAYAYYELGQSEPRLENLVRLAHFFDVTVDQLLNEDLRHRPFQPIPCPDLRDPEDASGPE